MPKKDQQSPYSEIFEPSFEDLLRSRKDLKLSEKRLEEESQVKPDEESIVLKNGQEITKAEHVALLEDIRRSDLTPGDMDRSRLELLIKPQGFEIYTDEQGNERLNWSEQQESLDELKQIFELIEASKHLSDQEFRSQILPGLKEELEKYSWFQALTSVSSEQRNNAHKSDPFQHTIEVLSLLDTSGLEPEQVAELRFKTLGHDLGKRFIARDDHYHDHAKSSALILTEYYISQGLTFDEANKRVEAIAYHHIFEDVDKQILTSQEALNLFKTNEGLIEASRLTVADAGSVEAYRNFAIKNGATSIEMLEILYQLFEDSAEDFRGVVAQAVYNTLQKIISILNLMKESIGIEEKLQKLEELIAEVYDRSKTILERHHLTVELQPKRQQV